MLYGKKARENDSEGRKKKYCGTILLGAVFSHRHWHSVTLYFFHHFLTFSSFSFSFLPFIRFSGFLSLSFLCFHGSLSVTIFWHSPPVPLVWTKYRFPQCVLIYARKVKCTLYKHHAIFLT